MKKNKKWFRSPAFTGIAFVLAIGLLLFSGINGARAALTYFSEVYTTELQMYDIGVALMENGTQVSHRNYNSNADNGSWDEDVELWNFKDSGCQLLSDMLTNKETGTNGKLVLNHSYPEVLTAQNPNRTNAINEFVRITIYKYWVDENGNKQLKMDPSWIDLKDSSYVGSSWAEDTAAATEKGGRRVFYYTKLLKPGDTTDPLTESISINNKVAKHVTQKVDGNKTTYTTTYTYDGYRFCVEARVDAVQDHNAAAAAKSAWGRSVTISGTGDNKTLQLAS